MSNPLAIIAAVRAARVASGLVSVCGIACKNQAQVDYYNARAAAPRDAAGRVYLTPTLLALKEKLQ